MRLLPHILAAAALGASAASAQTISTLAGNPVPLVNGAGLGQFIESRQVYPIGSVINVRFKIPAATNLVSCSAIVRNAQLGDGFGVQFLDISRENVQLIERQVAGESPREQAQF